MREKLKPTLWRTCRALASTQRLHLIRILDEHPELTVSQVADKADRILSAVSEDLRILGARGLLNVRRKGSFVYYRIDADPSIPFASVLLKAVIDALHAPIEDLDFPMKALTGLTHERRHRILYDLHRGPARFADLVYRCRISGPALKRHLRKLRDRDFVKLDKHMYCLSSPNDPLRRCLIKLASNPP